MLEYLFCALRNLGRKKLRTFLTVSGISIGVASVIIIGAIGEGGKTAVSGELDSLGINGLSISARGNADTISPKILYDDVKNCLSIKGVNSAMPIIMQMGTSTIHGKENEALVWGVGADAQKIIALKINHGSMFTQNDISSHALVCLVDEQYAMATFKRTNITGKTIMLNLGNGYTELKIKGVVATGSSLLYNIAGDYIPYFMYMPYTTAEDIKGQVGYDQIAVKTISDNNIDNVGKNIVKVLNDNNGNQSFIASNMFKQKQKLANLLNIVTLIVSAIGAISMIVAGLGIMTVMTVSVSERTKEIGIKKAIGAKKRIIMIEFLFEALAISIIGGLIGIVFGIGTSVVASKIFAFNFDVKLNSVLISAGFAMLVGVLFGVYPAQKAAMLRPVEALRHE